MAANVPDYDALPLNETLGLRTAWDLFGPGDQLGAINHLGAEERIAAAALVQRGAVFNLSLPLNLPDPPMFGRQAYRHTVFAIDRNTLDDYLDGFYLQASSQWDGLRHVAAREFGFFGGATAQELQPGQGPLGVERFADHGLFARAVLLDVAAYEASRGHPLRSGNPFPLTVEHLESCRRAQGVEIRPGDVLLIRTGWMTEYLAAGPEGRTELAGRRVWPGLYADEAMARYLWNHRVAAIAADNPALEVSPGDPAVGSLHRRILAMLGIPIGELWTFETLAADCSQDGRYAACLASVPLNLPGGVGSPANAIALK